MKPFEFFPKNKAVSIVALIFFIIVFVGVIGNLLIKNEIKNWKINTVKKVESIEITAKQILTFKQQKLALEKDRLIDKLKTISEPSFSSFHEILTKTLTEELQIVIYDRDDVVYWNENFEEQLLSDGSKKYAYNEIYFPQSEIYSFIGLQDTFSIRNTQFSINVFQIIEKEFELNEDYYNKISLSTEISEKVGVHFEIEYSPDAELTKDGRKHSFYVKNNFDNNIGVATFIKPSQSSAVERLEDIISTIQSILAIFGFIFLGYLSLKELTHISNNLIRIFSIIFFFSALRYLMILLKFPQSILSLDVLDDKYYYSNFGFGLASSPIDLQITLIFLSVIAFFIFKYSHAFYRSNIHKNRHLLISVVVILCFIFIYLLTLRGIGASFRGFVFDTSVRYFQSNLLSVSFPHFIMQLNVLLLGFISIITSAAIILIIISFLNKYRLKSRFILLLISFCILLIAEIFYTIAQNNPQLNLLIKFLQILFVFILVYLVLYYDIGRINKIILFFIASSIFSIISLLFYNAEHEKASLKTTVKIISRLDDEEWYKKLISETLIDNFSRKKAREAFSSETANYNSFAFKIWSKSQLQREAINSSVNFLSLSGELLGGFGSIYPRLSIDRFIDTNSVFEEIQIFEEPTEFESQKLIRGIFPVKDEFAFLGYLDVSILSDLNDFGFSSHPEFISTGKLNEKALLKLDKLVILDYRNSELKIVYGNLNPTQKLNDRIINAEFTKNKDAWINTDINNAEYIIYASKIINNNFERIIAVALRNKELTIGLFDFFKIFFTHSLILLLIILLYFLIDYRTIFKYKIDLRAKLLLVFLIISVIPLILTALFFRNLTEEKNNDAIYYKLGKRAFSIENYLNENYTENLQENIFSKASNDLNINYSIYKQNNVFYSSHDLLYDVGLLPKIINPVAYKELEIENSQEILVNESVDDFKFNSFYYKANFRGEEIIIMVSDGFNKIRLPLSGTEVDVFLFGFYSLTVVLIILFSAIFANQISRPIRKITSATRSVAAGDLSLELRTDAKGELGELVSGFEYMLKELKKNQTILAEIEREEAWKEMAKQVAHEIKNPLTPMKLSVQQLITAYNDKSDKFDKFFSKVTGTILNQIETLKNIATEFSHFARMPKLKLEDINCVEVIRQSLNLFTDENIKIVFDEPSEVILIRGDHEQLKRTIINLIRNAIQAHSTTINIKLVQEEDHYHLTIEDNGVGIPSDNIDNIFEPNFTTKSDGMGLGLSMAKRYIKSTGGDIIVEHSSPNGTAIKISFQK